ncbi:Ankyrin repeat domain containing protein [Pandoravirus neocaledonia]|uniref:Ankyrin repeat domain containing protein n=1 Tax=Pandoravirus neocaledonia TaxID=2107708 RepID=A0A2U7UDI5_9VIRU|nr:Ankyrin repeat domain containing protein [Pandoravirus neocaledonia]AVK76390.1 Ankyrin repeat domain containing protein [Pandoravirus neocaledonia]
MSECVNGDRPNPVIYDTCNPVAENGHLDALQWYHTRGYRWAELTCAYAARGGHLDVVKWLQSAGCPLTWHVCNWAAARGHADVVWWARDNGCEWNDVRPGFARNGFFDDLRKAHRQEGRQLTSATCDAAAASGCIDIVEWTLAQGCALSARTCQSAVEHGHVAMLDWLRAHDCPWDHAMWARAIVAGHLHVLAWAAAHGCRPSKHDGNVCNHAARRGRLSILEWLVAEQALPIDTTTCEAAAVAATSACSSGCAHGIAHGTSARAIWRQQPTMWRCSHGPSRPAVPTRPHAAASAQRNTIIRLPSSNGWMLGPTCDLARTL